MEKARNPKWPPEVAYRAALEVIELARRHPELDPRLNGVVDALVAGADAMRKAISETSVTRAELRSATAGQLAAARTGRRQVGAFRRAVRLAWPDDRALQRRFGVGEPINLRKVGTVASALQMVLEAATEEPEAVKEAGVLPEDLDALRATLDSLLSADSSQEARKVCAKGATAQRDRVRLEVEAAIGKVLAVAAVVFRDRPAIAAAFQKVVPGHGDGRRKEPAAAEKAADA